ncbi:type VI secretion system baseplate subunit TssG [Pseudomonas lini]
MSTLDAMHQEPWEYDFFQALRRIECESPDLPRLGHSLRLADDPLRLGQQADCTFAPATLASVQPGVDGAPARLEQFFFFRPRRPQRPIAAAHHRICARTPAQQRRQHQ